MGIDNLCLSLSVHRFLALQILLTADHKRGSHDVTFFFVGAFFGIAASAAVACNPSIRCSQERKVCGGERSQRTAREVLEQVRLVRHLQRMPQIYKFYRNGQPLRFTVEREVFTFLDLNGALVITLDLVVKHHTQLAIFRGSRDKDLALLLEFFDRLWSFLPRILECSDGETPTLAGMPLDLGE